MDPAPLISSRVHVAGTDFVSLELALRESSHFSTQVPSQVINEEFDRFKIWAGNIAAHRKGQRSLEYRLRDATHLREETHSLLTALHESLQRALAIVTGLRKPWDELSDSDSDSSDSGCDTELPKNDIQHDDTELKQLLASVKVTVTCLFRLSMAVRDPAPDSQHRSTITVDKSYFEEYDILHVKSKFPGCAQPLAARLGRAISGRRQYLSYRERHHEKLAKKIELVGFEEPRTEHTSNSTEATQTNSFEVLDGDDALSQTSYASSVNSNTAIRVPPLPKIAHEQEHFECPLCFMIVSIHTNAGWRQHVYRDLHPYCCTFDNCTTADRLYDSRHDWFNHELEAHRTSWQCIEGCEKMFSDKNSFELHVAARHSDLSSPDMLAALRRTSKRSADLSARVNCPLCDVPLVLHALQRHVGKHQEQLALFALPPNLEDTEEDAQDEDRRSGDSIIYMNEDRWTDGERELHPRFQDYIIRRGLASSISEGVEGSDNSPQRKWGLHDANETMLNRKADIERRCQQMEPPIPPNVLRHMDSFNAAVQISLPMTDYAWNVLRPRLLAQLPAAQKAEADHVSHRGTSLINKSYRRRAVKNTIMGTTPPKRNTLLEDERRGAGLYLRGTGSELVRRSSTPLDSQNRILSASRDKTAISSESSHEMGTVSTQNNLEIRKGGSVVDHKITGGILRKPTEKFPEDPEPILEDVYSS